MLSTRVPYYHQNFNPQRPSPFSRSASPSLQQPTLNPSTPRDYNRADQPSRTSDQPGVVRRDPSTNCAHPQRDLAINRIHLQGSGAGHSSAPRQPYQSYPPKRAYQTIAEDFDYKGTNNHPLEDLPDVGYAEEKPDDGDIFYTIEEPNELFVNFLGVESVCHRYKSTFSSKSPIHKHFKSNCVGQDQGNSTTPLPAPVLHHVIKSTASTKAVGSGYAFRDWNYATVIVCLTLGEIPLHTDVTSLCCLDTGCSVILVDLAWLFKKAPTEKILKIATPLKVRGIGASRHESDEFVSMSLYFSGVNSANRPAYAHVHKELHLVNGLKANLLVGNNILAAERVIIDLANKSAMISSCQMTISVAARPRGRPV